MSDGPVWALGPVWARLVAEYAIGEQFPQSHAPIPLTATSLLLLVQNRYRLDERAALLR